MTWREAAHRHARSTALSMAFMVLASTSAEAAAPVDTTWALLYVGRSTNEARWDPRMDATLRALLPREMLKPVQTNLSGPPGPVLGAGPSLALSACRSHDCGSKAFLWLDTDHGAAVAATASCDLQRIGTSWKWRNCALSIGSRAYAAEQVPAPALQALQAWLVEEDMTVGTAAFIGATHRRTAWDPSLYLAPPPYQPTAAGPGFDCSAAASEADKAVCAEPVLSGLDLQLHELYGQVRRGTATEPERTSLAAMQQQWRDQREIACPEIARRVDCLEQQYRARIDALAHWTPSQ